MCQCCALFPTEQKKSVIAGLSNILNAWPVLGMEYCFKHRYCHFYFYKCSELHLFGCLQSSTIFIYKMCCVLEPPYLIFKIMTAFIEHSSPVASCFPPTPYKENIGSRMPTTPNHLETLNSYLTKKLMLLKIWGQNVVFVIYCKCWFNWIFII